MANIAKRDQSEREVQVNRLDLVATLKTNREAHVRNYDTAVRSYKSKLLQQLRACTQAAIEQVKLNSSHLQERIAAMSDEDISKQSDSFSLLKSITVDMPVPRCYAKEYDAAIAMAEWDVNQTLTLTYAEFTCFVLDQWDWKQGFDNVTSRYL